MPRFYRIVFIFLLSFSTHSLTAQLNCQMEHYSGANGISHSTVTSILKDRDGFLWLGTWNGLNRFDGRYFKSYKSLTQNKTHLENPRIIQIEEGVDDVLWLKTYDKKVYTFDRRTEQFASVSLLLEEKFKKKIQIDKIFAIGDGYIWLSSTDDGLYGVRDDDRLLSQVYHMHQSSSSNMRLNTNKVNFLYQDDAKGVWIATEDGLHTHSIGHGGAVHSDPSIARATKGLHVTDVREDANQVYFVTMEGVLLVYNKQSRKLKKVNISKAGANHMLLSRDKRYIYLSTKAGEIMAYQIPHDTFSRIASFDESIGRMFEDSRGNLWLEPQRNGAILWDRSANRMITVHSGSNRFEPNVSFNFYEDLNQSVWISLKGGGFGYYDYNRNKLITRNEDYLGNLTSFPQQLYSSFFDGDVLWLATEEKGLAKLIIRPDNSLGKDNLSEQLKLKGDPSVRGILQDSKGRIWIGTKGGELLVKKNGNYEDAPIDNLLQTDFSGIYGLFEDKEGNIWIATKSNGIYIARPHNREGSAYVLENFNTRNSSLKNNQIYSILADDKGQIWLGTFGGGLVKVHRSGVKMDFQTILFNDGQHPKGSFDKIRNLTTDNAGNIWIATTYGLIIYDKRSKFKIYRDDYQAANSLGANDIQYLIKRKNGEMWICTSGGGVTRSTGNPFDGLQFQNYTTANGLSNDYVLSAAEDTEGNLWFATEGGLSKYIVNTGHFYAFGSSYGQSGFSFSEKTVASMASGEIFWGTTKGVLITSPEMLSRNRGKANLVFSSLFVNNKEIRSSSNGKGEDVNIQYTDQLVLHYDQNNISVDFTIVDYKEQQHNYLYRLTGLDSLWHNNQQLNRVTFTNLKPGRYVLEVKGNSDLYAESPYKRLVIIISPPWWKTWWAYTLYASLFLITLIFGWRILMTMLALKSEVEIEKRVSALKMTFFTNVSHELRTPLTLILSPIKRLLSSSSISDEDKVYASMVHRNAIRMESFVNQLLDLRKIQENKFDARFEVLDITNLLHQVTENFRPLAQERGIRIETDFRLDMLTIEADKSHIETILFNVLSNAVKYSPEDSTVSIYAAIQDAEDQVFIRIADQGVGVKEESLQHIFDLFYVAAPGSHLDVKSSGIGLALTKELVTLHNGHITAYNNPDKGLCVEMKLPIHQPGLSLSKDTGLWDGGNDYSGSTPVKESSAEPTEKPLVLVVEDNDDLQVFLKMELSAYYNVLTADDGLMALRYANAHVPDLIISDIMMQHMDGIALLNEIRRTPDISHIPVVLLSAKHATESQIQGMEHGADYYITKPFDVDFLRSSVDNLLRRRTQFFAALAEKREIVLKPTDLVITDSDEQFLRNVVDVVQDKMSDPEFNIDMVADALHMSRTTFYKKFKSLTKLAPIEFVRDMRLQRAAQLLKDGMDNISEVAYLAGFNNPKYFSTCFKEKYTISPKEFYKQKQSEID